MQWLVIPATVAFTLGGLALVLSSRRRSVRGLAAESADTNRGGLIVLGVFVSVALLYVSIYAFNNWDAVVAIKDKLWLGFGLLLAMVAG